MMKRIAKPVFSSFLISVGIFAQSALMFSVDAEIFKCTSKQGKVYYNDKPCPVESIEKKMHNEKDPVNGYVPNFPEDKKTLSKKSFFQTDSKSEVTTSIEELNGSNKNVNRPTKKPPRNSRSSGGHGGSQGVSNIRSNPKTPPAAAKKRLDQKLTVEEKKRILGIHRIPE